MGYRGLDERGMQQARRAERAAREREQFEQAWTRNQVVYWQERIDKLRVNDTGTLRSNITGMLHPGPTTTIEHSFLLYGLFVSNGTAREFGKGYTDSMGRTYDFHRGGEGTWNRGQLPFLLPGGEEYRHKHHLDRKKRVGPAWGGRLSSGLPHKARDWFFKKYYSSRMVLNEYEAAVYGQAYQGMLTQALDEMLGETRFL